MVNDKMEISVPYNMYSYYAIPGAVLALAARGHRNQSAVWTGQLLMWRQGGLHIHKSSSVFYYTLPPCIFIHIPL